MNVPRLLAFLVVFGSVVGGLHRYLWARWVRDVGWSPPVARALTAAIVLLGALVALLAPLGRLVPRALARPFAAVAYAWLGVVFLSFCALLVADVVRGVALVAADASFDRDRRALLARLVAAFGAAVGGGLGAIGLGVVAQGPQVKRLRVAVDRLPASLDGLVIAQITDLHVGPLIGRGFVEEVVATVHGLAPDVVAITGDLVDGSVDALREHVAPLADLRARHGVYFVTGNHEYYSGADAWIAELGRLGVHVLRNERVTIQGAGTDAIDLAGIDDASAHGHGHGPDLARAVEGRDRSRPLVLLAHQPRQLVDAEAHGVALQLSGHTHGGQIWPFGWLVRLQQPFVEGLHRRGDVQVYVSPGTGYWGPPMRVGTRCEVTAITLRRA
jgi:predicted MPP superfamily phosphohydrolase